MKRGRKPKEKKGYFYEKQEQAIIDYINSDSEEVRNEIFDEILFPALSKMIESIIRRYKLFVPDEEFEENFNDTISYLMTKIKHYKPVINEYEEVEPEKVRRNKNKYEAFEENEFYALQKNVTDEDPEFIKVLTVMIEDNETIPVTKYFKKVKKRYKAYSYCGTICRNYLMYKCSQYSKKRKRNSSYDTMFEDLNNNVRYANEEEDQQDFPEKLVKKVSNELEEMVNNAQEHNLNEDEITVGRALVNLLRNWEDVLPSGSNKLQKSTILYFLREETMMTTKQIRDNMKKYFILYNTLKKSMVNYL